MRLPGQASLQSIHDAVQGSTGAVEGKDKYFIECLDRIEQRKK